MPILGSAFHWGHSLPPGHGVKKKKEPPKHKSEHHQNQNIFTKSPSLLGILINQQALSLLIAGMVSGRPFQPKLF